ncbi:hypothetical protein [Roseicella aerolata]|uniref:Molecular chaperone DnaJ n=1 Tax=Roseicella aerolata TaxID=2883479 RepID=A0A9X1IH33_9PROT|nr:hypothetical protein [Roseicella aerolata]MCB4824430.1 hypothetical protein [Roseicella aerolata]
MAQDSAKVDGGTPPRNPGDQSAPGTSQTGMVPCPACHGSGRRDAAACPDCGGTGQVVQIVGDA